MSQTESRQLPPAWPALMPDWIACVFVGVSRATFHKLVKSGAMPRPAQLPGVTITRWRLADLQAFVDQLPVAASIDGEAA